MWNQIISKITLASENSHILFFANSIFSQVRLFSLRYSEKKISFTRVVD